MKHPTSSGLTLIELLTTLAIISMLGLSLPQLSIMLAKQRLASSQSELRLLVNRARLEALSRQQRITLCPLATDGRCHADWNGSLAIFGDANGNRRQDNGEPLLYQLQLDPRVQAQWRGMGPANSLHFSAQGVTFVSNGTFSLCHPGHNETIRLIVNRQGRVRTQRISQDCTGHPTI